MTTKEILIAARAKIEAPERWTQNAEARNASGDRVDARSATAVCLCSSGALRSVEPTYLMRVNALRAIYAAIGTHGLIGWNDAPDRTHAEVLAAFDRAIAAAESV